MSQTLGGSYLTGAGTTGQVYWNNVAVLQSQMYGINAPGTVYQIAPSPPPKREPTNLDWLNGRVDEMRVKL